jgi:hypothetical protein
MPNNAGMQRYAPLNKHPTTSASYLGCCTEQYTNTTRRTQKKNSKPAHKSTSLRLQVHPAVSLSDELSDP